MHKKRIPQGRADVLMFRSQIGRDLIKVRRGQNAPDQNECLLRYEEWRKADRFHIENIKRIAVEARQIAASPKNKLSLRTALEGLQVANRHSYEDALRVLQSRHLVELIAQVQVHEAPHVQAAFLDFLAKYL